MIELLVLHEEGIVSMDRVDGSETHVRTQRTQRLIGRFGTVMGEEEVKKFLDAIEESDFKQKIFAASQSVNSFTEKIITMIKKAMKLIWNLLSEKIGDKNMSIKNKPSHKPKCISFSF